MHILPVRKSNRESGFLFKGYPNLMTLETSSTIMDGVFHSSDVEAQSQLLKIIQAFLVAESAKHVAHEKGNKLRL